MSLKRWQSWGIDHLFRKPVPESEHPLSKEVLPSVQSKLPHVQLWTIPTSYYWVSGRRDQHLPLHVPSERCRGSNEVFLQPPFLLSRPTSEGFSLPVLFFQLCCPPLEAFCGHHILFKLWELRLGFGLFSFSKSCIFQFVSFHHLLFNLSFSPCSNIFILLYRHGYTHFYTVAVDLVVLLEGEKLKQWAVRHW